jgi:hypothetical protein
MTWQAGSATSASTNLRRPSQTANKSRHWPFAQVHCVTTVKDLRPVPLSHRWHAGGSDMKTDKPARSDRVEQAMRWTILAALGAAVWWAVAMGAVTG